MNIRPRRIGPAIRLALARRPWIRWLAICSVALAASWTVHTQMRRVDDARSLWTDQRIVHVAATDIDPGDELRTEERTLPEAAIPRTALATVPGGAVSRQYIASGEVLTEADVVVGAGPAASADPGLVVVAVSDPLLADASSIVSIGLRVQVHSDGLVLADRATVTAVEGDVVFVAIEVADAPLVSAAAQDRRASIAFVP